MKSSRKLRGRTVFENKGGIVLSSAGGSHLEVAGAVAMGRATQGGVFWPRLQRVLWASERDDEKQSLSHNDVLFVQRRQEGVTLCLALQQLCRDTKNSYRDK